MKMKIYIKLLAILLVNSIGGSTSGYCSTREMDSQCGFYCYEVVKPLLQYASSVRAKEEQFAELQAKIQLLEATEKNLNDAIKQKDFQLKQQIELSATYKNNKLIQEDLLRKQLVSNEAKDSKIQELNKSILNLQSENKSKDTKINEQNKIIKDNLQLTHIRLSDLQAIIKSKNMQIDKRDVEINELRSQIKSMNSNADKIKQLEAKLTKYQDLSKASSCLGKSIDVHTIQVPDVKTISVPCGSNAIGSGWTVIQRRVDGSVNFTRNWKEYKEGFGNLRREFFIGLENIHLLTQSQPHELYIYLEDFEGNTRYAHYGNFLIGNESEAYALKAIGDYTGDAGNSFHLHIGMKFSTPDRDNDTHKDSCAAYYKSGWWFFDCSNCNLNGPYTKNATINTPSVKWNAWKYDSLQSTLMMIRPKER